MSIIKKVSLLSLSFICTLTIFSLARPALAQDQTSASPAPAQAANEAPKDEVSKSTNVIQNLLQNQNGESKVAAIRYVPATPQNIVRVMWALGAYDMNDIDAINNYIHRTECDLYDKYYNDEFEWRKIQVATLSYLKKYAPSFSNYIEIIQPVQIGRYDFDLQGFSIRDESELENMTALQISDSQTAGTYCGFSTNDRRFATAAVVRLKNPINIDFIRVPHSLAKEYIKFLEDKQGQLKADKVVYFRYRIRIDRFTKYEALQNIGDALIFTGKVLQIDVYADQEMFLPLFSQKFD